MVTRTSIAVAAAAALSTGMLGGLATRLGPWYFALRKPSWQPPDWLFGPVWTLIFVLTAWSAVLAWNAAAGDAARTLAVAAFAANALLNVLWSVLFFALRRPDRALVECVVLWLSIVGMVAVSWPLSPRAGLLLLPYLAWVSFAMVLNRAIVRLNGPFRTR